MLWDWCRVLEGVAEIVRENMSEVWSELGKKDCARKDF